MSDSVMAPTPRVERRWTLTSLFSSVSFASEPAMASTEPCTSPLMMTGSILAAPAWMSWIITSMPRPFDLGGLQRFLLAHTEAGDLACFRLVGDDNEVVARVRRAGQALYFGRLARQGFLDDLAPVVVQRFHAAPFGAGNENIADFQRTLLDEDGRDRALALLEAGFAINGARAAAVRVGAQVQDFGLQQDGFLELFEAFFRFRRNLDALAVAAHAFGHDFVLQQLLADLVAGSRWEGRIC